MNFGDSFLNHVKAVVTEDYNKCIYKFSWSPGGEVEMTTLYTQISQSRYTFLPTWFTDKASELIKN